MTDTSNPASAPVAVQAPDAGQVAALTPESRAEIAKQLGWKYPNQKAEIDGWYQQAPAAPATQGENFDAMFPAAAPKEIQLDTRFLTTEGHDIADIGAFTASVKDALAATQLPAVIASAVGNEMLRNAMEAQRYSDPEKAAEASTAKWSREKELVLRVAKVPWEDVRENVKRALNLMPKDMLDQIVRSDALNSASVVLQLHTHGLRLAARDAMKR